MAIEVHRILGPGLLESVYGEALYHELALRGLPFVRQQNVSILLQGIKPGADLCPDLLVEDNAGVDLKAGEQLSSIEKPKFLIRLRLKNKRLG